MQTVAVKRLAQTSTHFNKRRFTAMTDVSKYKLNHSMIRIKDPKVTVPFYEKNFGMKLLHKMENSDAKFDLCES